MSTYETPEITELGSVEEFTAAFGGGSSDFFGRRPTGGGGPTS